MMFRHFHENCHGLPSCVLAAMFAVLFFLSGCTTAPQHNTVRSEVLVMSSDLYDNVFDVAVAVSRELAMPPEFLDRRHGVIETSEVLSGSLIEPWKPGHRTLQQSLQNTLSLQRRRCRIEFIPVEPIPGGFDADVIVDDSKSGADLLGLDPFIDLTTYEGEIELRVWVYVERAYVPGFRRDPWSRRLSSRATILPTDRGAQAIAWRYWMPISRDLAFEQDVLRRIARRADRIAHVSALDPSGSPRGDD